MSVLSFNSFATSAKSPAQFVSVALFAIAISACASSGGKSLSAGGQKADYENAIGSFTSPASDPTKGDPIASAAYWGTQFQQRPDDAQVAVNYSAALRKIGSVEEAVKIITAATNRSDSVFVKLEAGKALIEGGRAFEAVRYLEEASKELPNNWSALSAYGVALDQIGEHQTAQVKYDQALALSPGSPILMNNKGLSFAMAGDLERAAYTLRSATSLPGADARVRQNLALVLALKGDLYEAERLARSDLPPQIADRNIDYFRSLFNQPAYWQDVADNTVDVPEFDQPIANAAPLKTVPTTPAEKPQSTPAPLLKEETKVEAAITVKEEKTIATTGAAPVTNASTEPASLQRLFLEVPEINVEEPEIFVDPSEDLAPSPDLKN